MRYIICKVLFIVCLTLFICTLTRCKKFVEIEGPNTSINSANVYQADATAISVLTGIYAKLSASNLTSGDMTSTSFLIGLSSDELKLYNADASSPLLNYYLSNSLGVKQAGYEFWNNIYQTIYVVNVALEGVSNSNTLTPAVKKQLSGEAKFMRALCFFYLVNLYGDVPLVVSTDYKVNSIMPRTPKELVWKQIISDLRDAQTLLNSDYLDATLLKITKERVRPTKWAATALLARSYLYLREWDKAEEQASTIISNSSMYKVVGLDDVFKKNSLEAIFQLQPTIKGSNTQDANAFIINYPNDFSKPVLSQNLINSFEPGDQRRNSWVKNIVFDDVTYFFPFKYKIVNLSGDLNAPVEEYATVFRLGEQYLIRAEARIQQNRIAEGIDDLNILRDRATNKDISTDLQLKVLSTNILKDQALMAVEHERQVELFTEWGHRWLDLKRTNRIDAVMTKVVPEKVSGGIWKSYQQLYPLPLSELQFNSKLVQNIGY